MCSCLLSMILVELVSTICLDPDVLPFVGSVLLFVGHGQENGGHPGNPSPTPPPPPKKTYSPYTQNSEPVPHNPFQPQPCSTPQPLKLSKFSNPQKRDKIPVTSSQHAEFRVASQLLAIQRPIIKMGFLSDGIPYLQLLKPSFL